MTAAPTPALVVTGLTVRYGGVVALHDVSLTIGTGEVAGLIGPNGAGKTTFIDCLTGFATASTGRIELRGERLDDVPAHERTRRGLVRTFQSLELFDDLTVRENLSVAAAAGQRGSLLADLFRPRRDQPVVVDEVLAQLGLEGLASRRPDGLSNGERHLVALARALVARPALLLLDEPAAGLDPAETSALAQVVAALPALGISVLLVDHDMSIVLGVCDTVHVLDFGGLIASGTPAEVRSDPLVISAYLGSAAST